MNTLVIPLPFVSPEEEGLESCSRPGFTLTTRSRFADVEREESLLRQIDEAMPHEVEALLSELDAHRAEVEADEKRAQEEADAKYDEENSRW